MKYSEKLNAQLKLYDIITKAERRRIVQAFKKYGDSYKSGNLIDDIIEEVLDIFGYACLMKMRDYELRKSAKAD